MTQRINPDKVVTDLTELIETGAIRVRHLRTFLGNDHYPAQFQTQLIYLDERLEKRVVSIGDVHPG